MTEPWGWALLLSLALLATVAVGAYRVLQQAHQVAQVRWQALLRGAITLHRPGLN